MYEHGIARILIFAKNELKITVRDQSTAQSDLPTITCEIGLGNERKTIVNCFYREFTGAVSGLRDKASQIERLGRQITVWKNACSGTKDVVILGDANICASKWLEEDYHGKDLADMV